MMDAIVYFFACKDINLSATTYHESTTPRYHTPGTSLFRPSS